jgi:hypothetical protein
VGDLLNISERRPAENHKMNPFSFVLFYLFFFSRVVGCNRLFVSDNERQTEKKGNDNKNLWAVIAISWLTVLPVNRSLIKERGFRCRLMSYLVFSC